MKEEKKENNSICTTDRWIIFCVLYWVDFKNHKYWNWQAWANNVDVDADHTLKFDVWSGSTLFATNQKVLDLSKKWTEKNGSIKILV